MAEDDRTIREKILEALEEAGGEVVDEDGMAAVYFYERMPEHARSTVSTVLGQLIDEGVLWDERPSPKARRRTRIAMTKYFPKPKTRDQVSRDFMNQIKNLVDDFEKEIREMDEEWISEVEKLESRLDAEIRRRHEVQEALSDAYKEMDELRELNKDLKGKVGDAKRKATSVERQRDELQKELTETKTELAEVNRQNKILERNIEKIRKQKVDAAQISDVIDTVGDRLTPQERRDLEAMMRRGRET